MWIGLGVIYIIIGVIVGVILRTLYDRFDVAEGYMDGLGESGGTFLAVLLWPITVVCLAAYGLYAGLFYLVETTVDKIEAEAQDRKYGQRKRRP